MRGPLPAPRPSTKLESRGQALRFAILSKSESRGQALRFAILSKSARRHPDALRSRLAAIPAGSFKDCGASVGLLGGLKRLPQDRDLTPHAHVSLKYAGCMEAIHGCTTWSRECGSRGWESTFAPAVRVRSLPRRLPRHEFVEVGAVLPAAAGAAAFAHPDSVGRGGRVRRAGGIHWPEATSPRQRDLVALAVNHALELRHQIPLVIRHPNCVGPQLRVL